MHKKIYIIGPVGSGKTTFATKLSKKYNIKYYELDKISWDDDNGHIKRPEKEALELFQKILKNNSWVIEDIGRELFKQGRNEADIIYYIKLSKAKAYYRVTKRIIKQRLGKERYNHPPTFKEWLYYLSIINSYYKKEKNKIKSLEKCKDKLEFVNSKDIKKIIRNGKEYDI
ncbi:MAG: AAA family ATPase [Bacilli bacterium]|nr:AAA family ATPase [Bacilli bacterium]